MNTPPPSTYDAYAAKADWDRSERLHRWNARRLLHHLTATTGLPERASLLEVGTGTGRVASAAVDSGWQYEGIEPTTALREMTAQRYGVTVHDAALPDLPDLPPFDATLALHVLEHAPDQYAARAWLDAMRGAVRPRGFVLIASPDIRDYRHTFWESDWSHGWPTTPYRVADLMRDVGLEPIVVKTLRLGSLSTWNLAGKALGGLIPTRPVDALTRRVTGRPLATGLKIASLWGLTFVVGSRAA